MITKVLNWLGLGDIDSHSHGAHAHANHGTGAGQHKFETNVSERILRQLGHGAKCVYEIDGKVCHGSENDGVHDLTMGYAAYHEFVAPETANAATGD